MKSFLKSVGILVASLGLVACGSNSSEGDVTTLTISATAVPHVEILEAAEEKLNEEGVNLDIIVATDYNTPNVALSGEDVDANFFQHRPYLESQMNENNYNFVEAAAIHLEPMGLYSPTYNSLEELPENATVLMSDSVADQGRVFSLLHEAGLITLEGGTSVDASEQDIIENSLNLQFKTSGVDANMLTTAYNSNEADIIAINSNFAIGAGMDPLEDSIFIEEANEENPFVNLIVVRDGDENNQAIQTLVKVLQSDEIKSFIEDSYEGAVVPVE
ncbi:MetQ/NlpA family ABC transporter substrate-binding protein [Shouchella miscanthi]|uniref:Lipoprotein n=1 Tax=Shouchella miscanthi TaxID=2598861 RepID=A0ABU6NM79_9BACI|nr:MetQ/NlpA family ABC transporter substrate-binding protein [Shouchella miscanthi]